MSEKKNSAAGGNGELINAEHSVTDTFEGVQDECTVESSQPTWEDVAGLSDSTVAMLDGSAILPGVALRHGIFEVSDLSDPALPDDFEWLRNRPEAFPLVVFPMRDCRGFDTYQVRPDEALDLGEERPTKYLSPKGDKAPAVVVVRDNPQADEVLIVEGTKQALAVDSWAGERYAILGLTGITSWSRDGYIVDGVEDLVDGRNIVIWPDADAKKNLSVYEGASALGQHCDELGASSVKFASPAGGGKLGADDMLAKHNPDKRGAWVDKIVSSATANPAKKRPSGGGRRPHSLVEADGRPIIEIGTDDRAGYIDEMLELLRDSGNVYNLGGTLVQVRAPGRSENAERLEHLNKDRLRRFFTEHARVVKYTKVDGSYTSPELSDALLGELSTYVDRFPEVVAVSTTPVVTDDGKVITKPGYDEETGYYLSLTDDLEGTQVPDNPTLADVNRARDFLVNEWVDQFPWRSKADLVNYLGAVLTLLVRPMVDLVPALLVDANGKGSGKSLLVDLLSIVVSGLSAQTTKLPGDNDEINKLLVAGILRGKNLYFFDESGEIDSSAINAFITAEIFGGRILGVSEEVKAPNQSMVIFAGNNIEARGDFARRFVKAGLFFDGPSPENRTGFRIDDLREFTRQNRRKILESFLTLVQWWNELDRPEPQVPFHFGSFEKWQNRVSGILQAAGIEGHLENVLEDRSDASYDDELKRAHLLWLLGIYGTKSFLARDVVGDAKQAGEIDFAALPGLSFADLDATALGLAYRKLRNVWQRDIVLRERGKNRNGSTLWAVEVGGDGNDNEGGDSGSPDTGTTPPPDAPEASAVVSPTVFFDLETGSADEIHVTDDPGFVRLATYSVDGGKPVSTTDIAGDLVPLLESAGLVVGHNILQYDLPVLRRLYGLDVDPSRVHDTLVMARLETPPLDKRKYDLGSVAQRYGVDGKLLSEGESVLKKLDKQYGGFDKIPVDNVDYVKYALQDVQATVDVYAKLLPLTLKVVGPDYLRREHEKIHRISLVEAHGIRVNTALVDQMLAAEESTREEIIQWLVDEVGVPSGGKAPWASAAGKQAIGQYIERHGGVVPRTSKSTVSVSKDSLAALVEQYSDVPKIRKLAENLTAVLQSKSPASTVKKHLHGDRVYPSIRSTQATGRLSTTKPGMTIFGSRDERLLAQRGMILPDSDDHCLISVDLSQIDARCMAAGSGDEQYAELFAEGRDAHTEMAVRIFEDASRRSDAKALAHAANYGMGPRSFALHAGITVVEAQTLLDTLHREFPRLEVFKERLREAASVTGYVTTGFGRRVSVARDRAYTAAPAGYGQGTARDAFLEGVMALPDDIADMIRIFVHDEVVLSVPASRAEEIKQLVVAAFESVTLPSADGVSVPVFADAAGPGASWAECK